MLASLSQKKNKDKNLKKFKKTVLVKVGVFARVLDVSGGVWGRGL